MHRLFKPLFWTLLFLLMVLGLDQLLVQVPPVHPAHAAVRSFYTDFRGRLFDLASGERSAAPKALVQKVEAVIEESRKKAAPKAVAEPEPEKAAEGKPAQRYIYSDEAGELHFVDALEEVPEKYRPRAQPMGQ